MKRLLVILAMFSMLLAGGLSPAAAYNPLQPCQTKSASCANPCPSGSTAAVCVDAANQQATDNPVVDVIAKATKIISLIIGFAAVILIMVSGLTLILSGGNPEAVKTAKSRIVGAIVGLVVAALAYTLASFVLAKL